MMKKLLVVYHTRTGGSLQIAEAIVRGAKQEPQIQVTLVLAQQAKAEQLLSADGFIFIAPEMLGSLSGVMKDFFDRTYYDVLDQLNGRPYAAVICAGSDGFGALRQLEKIVTGWRLKKVAETRVVLTLAQTKEKILQPKNIDAAELKLSEELGATLASGLHLSIL